MVVKKISILISCLFVAHFAFGQKSLLKRNINYSASNERLEDVLRDISYVGEFSFSYNPDLLPVDSLMSISVENSSINDVLQVLLGTELELKISGNHLVILKSKFSASGSTGVKKTSTINGYIRDSSTGVGVPYAVVFDVSKLNSAISDSSGFFSLEITTREEAVGLAIAKIDFQDTALVIKNNTQRLDVSISPVLGNVEVEGSTALGKSSGNVNNLKVVKLVTPKATIAYGGELQLYTYKFAQVSFLPFLGTNMRMSGTTENNFSFNILAGYNGATNGVEIGGLFNIDKHYAKGVQIAGLGNIVGNELVGLQLAGIFNTNLGNVTGVQIAGINNVVLDTLRGLQLAGISNVALQNVDGVQVSGISNVAIKDVNRMQISGISNVGKNIGGAQIAGIVNTSAGTVKGIQIAGIANGGRVVKAGQIAGIMNVASDTVSGVQIAGILNFAKFNKGLQLGLINISDTVSGVSVGLLNLVWKGYNKIELYTSEVLYMSFRIKLGTRKFYNIFGAGMQSFAKGSVWGYTYGMGGVIRLGKSKNDLNIELNLTDLQNRSEWGQDINLNVRFNVHYAQHITKRLKIFAGPTWSNLIYPEDHLNSDAFLLDIPPYTLYDAVTNGTVIQGWIGFEVGLRVL